MTRGKIPEIAEKLQGNNSWNGLTGVATDVVNEVGKAATEGPYTYNERLKHYFWQVSQGLRERDYRLEHDLKQGVPVDLSIYEPWYKGSNYTAAEHYLTPIDSYPPEKTDFYGPQMGSSEPLEINVYIDGKQLYGAVKKAEQTGGFSIGYGMAIK